MACLGNKPIGHASVLCRAGEARNKVSKVLKEKKLPVAVVVTSLCDATSIRLNLDVATM